MYVLSVLFFYSIFNDFLRGNLITYNLLNSFSTNQQKFENVYFPDGYFFPIQYK